ncbi:hypothetical protein JCM10908_006473 [Rhodotorula pacifica]|uniref:uncharacterized protein n=1 Tax=Rhodotorula pacifica TaxID=1495444 RepID=UPI00317D7BF4
MAVAMSAAPPLLPIPLENAPPSPNFKAAPVPVTKEPPISPLALFAAEMVSWLWFAPSASKSGAKETSRTSSEVAKLQIQPTQRFLRFCQEVLSTTQVSVSVVLLALLLVSRLKQQNAIDGAPGSEYRLAVTGLMLANKILDDQTYTAQTWSQVSSLELKPLVAGEVEFLRGLDWSLHVSEQDYNAWLRLLQGHVASRNARLGKTPPLQASAYATPSRRTAGSRRARLSASQSQSCGIEVEIGQAATSGGPAPSTLEDPFADGRRTRRKLALSSSGRSASSVSPPFRSQMPLSAPVGSNASSASLPIYRQADHSSSFISPPSLQHIDLRPALSTSLGKRSAMEAFGRSSVGSLSGLGHRGRPLLDQTAESMAMSRSHSAGHVAPPYPPPSISGRVPPWTTDPLGWYCPPLQPMPFAFGENASAASSPLYSRPSSPIAPHSATVPAHMRASALPPHLGGDGAFSTLVDSFSPRYDPEHYKQMQQGQLELGYYALAAGQGLGYYQTMHPAPIHSQQALANPFAQYPAVPLHPAYPYSMSAAPSPVARAARWQSPPFTSTLPHPYAPRPAHGCSPLSMRPTPLPPLADSHRRVSGGSASSPLGSTTSTPQSLYAPSAPPYPPPLPSSALAPPSGAETYRPSHLTPVRAPYLAPELPPIYTQLAPAAGQPQPAQRWSAYCNAGIPGVYWRG